MAWSQWFLHTGEGGGAFGQAFTGDADTVEGCVYGSARAHRDTAALLLGAAPALTCLAGFAPALMPATFPAASSAVPCSTTCIVLVFKI